MRREISRREAASSTGNRDPLAASLTEYGQDHAGQNHGRTESL